MFSGVHLFEAQAFRYLGHYLLCCLLWPLFVVLPSLAIITIIEYVQLFVKLMLACCFVVQSQTQFCQL